MKNEVCSKPNIFQQLLLSLILKYPNITLKVLEQNGAVLIIFTTIAQQVPDIISVKKYKYSL